MPRMKLLNSLEREAFKTPPFFNSAERKRFFALPMIFSETMASLRTPTNKVYFIVTAGYFKARRAFFAKQFRPADVEFVARQLGLDAADVHLPAYDKQTYARHQRLILDYFGFSPFHAHAKSILAKEIAALVWVQLRPKLVFLEVEQLLVRRKIARPGYFVLSTLITTAVTRCQRELAKIVKAYFTEDQRTGLDALLKKDLSAGDEDGWRSRLTLLKQPYQSTQPSKVKANLQDLQTLQELYLNLKPVVQRLGLSYEWIRHYAYSVIKAQIPQVSRRAAADRYLHLITFVVYQTFKLNDTLIDIPLNAVQATVNVVDKECKETYFQERDQRHESFSALVGRLRQNIRATLSAIKRIVADGRLSDSQKIASIDTELNTTDSKPGQMELQFDEFEQSAAKIQQGPDRLALLEARSLKLQHRVADIVRQIQFAPNCSSPALWDALLHYQQKAGAVDKTAPVDFLPADQRSALLGADGKFRISLYKALLYVQVAEAIKSGALNLIHSEKYRSLDDYLIPAADWQAQRSEYLQRAQLEDFADCRATLHKLGQRLDERYAEVNKRIQAGDNPHWTIRANGTFHVKTPQLEDAEHLSLGSFFPERKYISLLEALATANQATNFLGEFEHWQVKYQRAKPATKIFFAGIIGYGCDIGHRKLAQISKQIDENELENVVNWYFSLENVQGANDRIVPFLDRMDLPNRYRREEEVLHTSSDGQKFEVAVDSLNANYSFKYLGKDRGVSVVTFIDMRDLMWHSTVISSAEREAAYVIDGLMHNDVIKSDVHSTDTHGYSEVIFATTYGLGFEYAPRIKGVGRQQLYAFEKRQHYEELGYTLLPDRYVHEAVVEEQWDEILRFIATIRWKVTTASQLFK
jgi:Tn3 transposase DDE domain/Domain of unknown function (DUF4158)